jgi:hypothetical protein
MPIKKLFLAHYSGDAQELCEQATELCLRGIIPWVDKASGFTVGDDLGAEARRAIREDCFGLLLYATASIFDRPFIRDVEIDEARKVRARDASFALFAVPRGIGFEQLQTKSLRSFNVDLSLFHTVPIPEGADLYQAWSRVADEVLRKVLLAVPARETLFPQLSLQYSTRELMPHEPNDLLCINATALLGTHSADVVRWNRLLQGLQDVKRAIAQTYGRPRLKVHGSKHLSAAFLFGRVFAPFALDVRQTPTEFWGTDPSVAPMTLFTATVRQDSGSRGILFLEIASRYKNIAAGVDCWIASSGMQPSIRLQLQPSHGPLIVTNELCGAMIAQTYVELERVVQAHTISEIHIFAAAPQAFMMLLGREFKGMPPVQLYEWDGSRYWPSCFIPSGIL